MKRFIVLAAVAALVIAVPLTHDAFAAKEAKVFVCHLNSSNTPATFVYEEYAYFYGYEYSNRYEETWWFGNVIEVAESAVPAHVGHGDSTWYGLVSDEPDWIATLESWDMYDLSYSWDYRPYEDIYGHWGNDYTNGEVKNADCFFPTSSY